MQGLTFTSPQKAVVVECSFGLLASMLRLPEGFHVVNARSDEWGVRLQLTVFTEDAPADAFYAVPVYQQGGGVDPIELVRIDWYDEGRNPLGNADV